MIAEKEILLMNSLCLKIRKDLLEQKEYQYIESRFEKEKTLTSIIVKKQRKHMKSQTLMLFWENQTFLEADNIMNKTNLQSIYTCQTDRKAGSREISFHIALGIRTRCLLRQWRICKKNNFT